MGAEVPLVQCDMAQTGEAENSPDASTAWMDKLLQADGSQRSAGRPGRLDQTETALPVVAAVEEAGNPDEEPAKSGAE